MSHRNLPTGIPFTPYNLTGDIRRIGFNLRVMPTALKKLLLAVLVPALFLALFEGILRLSGIGQETDFLIPAEVEGEPVWVENPFFTYTMFDPALARIPASIVARKNKPDDLFRVVVLGESAAMGDPIPGFGVPRVLEFALRHANPGVKVEVINAAITAINSYAIKDIARDLKKLKPDTVILYIGNNEVIGPYGPGTTFSGYLASDSMIDFMRWINRSRISQLIRQSIAIIHDRRENKDFGGVAMFINNPVPADDPRLEAVRRRYARNMKAIINSARNSGAHVLVSSVAVNRENCPPSISTNRTGIAKAELRQWKKYVDQGTRLASLKNWPEALSAFVFAEQIDDQHAALTYWIGTCLRETGRSEEARTYFSRAMNLDAFRYRTGDALNEIARGLVTSAGEGVTFVDASAAFMNFADVTDDELFVDHVHFSFEGTARLASVWVDALSALSGDGSWTNRNGFPTTQWLKNELLYKTMAEISVAQEMARRYSKPPFTLQLNRGVRLRALQEQARALNEKLRAETGDSWPEDFRDRLIRYPDDLYFPMHFAQQLVANNRFYEARPVAEAAVQKHPHRRGPRSVMAHLLAVGGKTQEAADILFDYQKGHGYFAAMSSSYILSVLTSGGYYEESAAVMSAMKKKAGVFDYRHRIAGQFKNANTWRDQYAAARRHLVTGQLAMAEQIFATLSRIRPDLGEPFVWLGVIQGMRGHPGKGFPVFQQGLERTKYLQAHYFAALWQARSEKYDEARALLEKTARLANDDIRFVNSLAWIYAADPRPELRDPVKARELLEGLLQRIASSSPSPFILDILAAAMAGEGDYDSAVATAELALNSLLASNDELRFEIQGRLEKYKKGMTTSWGMANGPAFYF